MKYEDEKKVKKGPGLGEKEQDHKALLVAAAKDYESEAKEIAEDYQDKARHVWDVIHGRKDWSHKEPGQTTIHINRVGIAHEQLKSQFRQSLMNPDKWLVVEPSYKIDENDEVINSSAAKRIVERGISRTNPRAKITDNIGIALAENLLATKLIPRIVETKTAHGKVEEIHIEHQILDMFSYFKDPHADGDECLYEFQETYIDKHILMGMSADKPNAAKPYLKSEVEKITSDGGITKEKVEQEEAQGKDNHQTKISRRMPILVQEFWATVLDESGDIMTYVNDDGKEILCKDVVFTIANGKHLIGEPKPFPSFDSESLFVSSQLLRSNVNSYGRSILAPGVDMNDVEDELFSAAVDAAKKEAYNANIMFEEGLSYPEQADGGLKPGVTYFQNSALPVGVDLIKSVKTGNVPQGLMSLLAMAKQSGVENMYSNIPASGSIVNKNVKATEMTIANQSVGGLIETIAADLEDIYLEAYAKKVFHLMLQYKKYLTEEDLIYIFDGSESRIARFKETTPKQLFKSYGGFFRFRGKGIRSISTNMRHANVIIQVMNMIMANPLMAQSFERQGIDVTKMVDDVMVKMGLDVDSYKNEDLAQFAQARQLKEEEALGAGGGEGATANAPKQSVPPATDPGQGGGL